VESLIVWPATKQKAARLAKTVSIRKQRGLQWLVKIVLETVRNAQTGQLVHNAIVDFIWIHKRNVFLAHPWNTVKNVLEAAVVLNALRSIILIRVNVRPVLLKLITVSSVQELTSAPAALITTTIWVEYVATALKVVQDAILVWFKRVTLNAFLALATATTCSLEYA